MRLVMLIAGLLLAANVMAEEKPKTVTKELDKSSPILMSTESDDESSEEEGKTRAQDYNSSRSNTTSAVGDSRREKGSGLATGRRGHVPAGDASDDGGSRGTDAQDYNSSRSNNTNGEADGNGDSLGKETRCSKVSEECVGDGDDQVVRKKPGGK